MTTGRQQALPPTEAAAVAEPAERAPGWGTLWVVLTGIFMITLDFFIVNVAIPSTQADLGASAAQIEFVVAGYGLAYAAGLITGGRLGDLYGRRRMFSIGLALFTLASAACGLAPDAGSLVAARILQGVAAAAMAPQVLAILGVVYTGRYRAAAFNAYGLTMGIAGIFGQLIGGALIQSDLAGLGWRMCFLINLPVGLVALLLVPRVVPESRAPGRERPDLVGALLITLGLVATVLPLVEGREHGWPMWTWLTLAAAGPLLAAFAAYQHRLAARGGAPLMNLALFRQRAFGAGIVTTLVYYSGMASFFLVFALYLQQGRGLSALEAGLMLVPQGLGFMAASFFAGRLAARLGRQVLAVGGVALALGVLGLDVTVEAIGVGGSPVLLVPALVVGGVGMGLIMAPLASIVLAGVVPRHVGAASGVLSTALQVGNSLGVALIGVVFYGALDDRTGADRFPHAYLLSSVLLLALAVAVVALVQLLPGRRAAAPAPAAA
ncbi:MFS transporter [Micromonospora siamensis]|uniref:Drug resistance transporter, EmrB/QacA subfamily n=1 Tax=Micromonospora siamensis TaxID=299152 RepID=A0A1C5HUJ5_9ACTN|nr:MFS transporter [Micromonospora siamensis]SCG49680.1 drug resistance transporter, EmrB/QacA subfamily [Micromonospora siamensis]